MVERRDEAPALGGEHRLRRLGVSELASAMRVAARLDDTPRRVDPVEAVLRVGGQRPAERRELARDRLAALLGLILEHGHSVVGTRRPAPAGPPPAR